MCQVNRHSRSCIAVTVESLDNVRRKVKNRRDTELLVQNDFELRLIVAGQLRKW